MSLVKTILRHLPSSKVIGSSTSGVIIGGELKTDCCMISVTEFQNSHVKTCIISLSDALGTDIRGSILADRTIDSVVTQNSVCMLTFFAHSFIKIDSFINRVNERAVKLQLIGGIANTPENPFIGSQISSFVFDNESVSDNSLAVAVIDSENLHAYGDLIYVTEPVGGIHTITDADGMIIRAIDGENTVDWYQKQLGISFDDDSVCDTTVLFPLVRADYDDIPWALTYSPQNDKERVFPDEPDPVMFVPNEAKIGEKVRISYSSIQKNIEVCEDVCHNISEHPAEVLFGYSCVSRQLLFSNCVKWELIPFRNTNLSGSLVAGEIGNLNGKNHYCNYSFSISALSESERKIRIDTDILRKNSAELTNNQEHIVQYLLKYNSKCSENENLLKRQQEIEESLFKDDDTGIDNIT
ncbi:MAG: hypothetical protein K2H19_02465, partial [Ruminococcus sp.]|nr:hypothetical protein [Ruminococcus sp.]